MNHYTANDIVSENFIYKKDSINYKFYDVWNVAGPGWIGDCEDYALTVLWYMSDQNVFKFFYNLMINPSVTIWYVTIKSSGSGHAILRYNDEYVDNIQRKWFSKNWDCYSRYDFKFPLIPPLIAVKMVMSLPFVLYKKFNG